MDKQEISKQDTDKYLAHIRKTIADSESLVSQVELRIAETDRMLASQGLTREQVMSMRFSEAQIEAVNAELKRRGMDPLEIWGAADAANSEEIGRDEIESPYVSSLPSHTSDVELDNRQKKFGMMMKPFQL